MEKEMTRSYFVSGADANPEGVLSIIQLTSRIIEIATAHANSLHIGNPYMTDVNGGWVLGRLTIQMEEWPTVNTDYQLTTWVESWNRLYSTRCFEISSPDGKTYGYARTLWMVINLSTHENLGLRYLNFDTSLISGKECPIPLQAKHRIPDARPAGSYTFTYTDLDYYRHVNTLKWIEILLDRYSLNTFDDFMIHRFEISFMREGRYGMTCDIYREDVSDGVTTEWAVANEGQALVHSRISLHRR